MSPNRHGRPGRPAREPRPPIWARPEPRGRGPAAALSRDQIAETALAIADAEGIDAVSHPPHRPRAARGPDVALPLLRLARRATRADGRPHRRRDGRARRAARRLARRAEGDRRAQPPGLRAPPLAPHHAARAHARDAEPAAPHRAVGPGGPPLVEAGFDPGVVSTLVAAVDDYTVGYTIRDRNYVGTEERARASRGVPGAAPAGAARQRRVPAGPLHRGGRRPPRTQRFEEGLEWLLDGFAAKLGL